jgi:hypothetical protein
MLTDLQYKDLMMKLIINIKTLRILNYKKLLKIQKWIEFELINLLFLKT